VALLEKYRTVIYAHFVEQVGEEAAEAMLAQFPSRDLDEPVTKEFVALTAAELRTEIGELRAELKDEIHQLRAELKDEIHQQTDRVITRLQIEGGIAVIVLAVVNALVG
jgi:hypothetical protein